MIAETFSEMSHSIGYSDRRVLISVLMRFMAEGGHLVDNEVDKNFGI